MVCLAVYMQQILEQYEMPFSGSREPTQATNTTVLGSVPSEGRYMAPPVGPDARGETLELHAVDDVGHLP